MPHESQPKIRKIPFATVIDFNIANLKEAIRLVKAHDLTQVQFCSKSDKGFHAMVYPASATFYASYSVPRRLGIQARRTGRIAVGVFGLHTIAQAHAAFLDVRRKAFAGIDPMAVKAPELTYAQFHVDHYRLQCISRQKKTLQTDLGRYGRVVSEPVLPSPPEFVDQFTLPDLPLRQDTSGTRFNRSAAVREAVLKRANGFCEYCGAQGFRTAAGSIFLETHHVIALSDQGFDHEQNIVAICPTDHRRAHFGEDWSTIQKVFLKLLADQYPDATLPLIKNGS